MKSDNSQSSVFSLILSNNPKNLISVICSVCRIQNPRVIHESELRKKTILQIFKTLREMRCKCFIIGCDDLVFQRRIALLHALSLLVPTRKRIIIDKKGNVLVFSRVKFVFIRIPQLFMEIVATLLMLLFTYLFLISLFVFAGRERKLLDIK